MSEQPPDRQQKHRLAILRHAEEVNRNVAATCRYCGISRQLFYTWQRRYDAERVESLNARSRRPRTSPRATRTEVIGKIIHLRQNYHFRGVVECRPVGPGLSNPSTKPNLGDLVDAMGSLHPSSGPGARWSHLGSNNPTDWWFSEGERRDSSPSSSTGNDMNLLHPVIAIAAAAATMAGVAGCGAETGQGRAPGTVTDTTHPASTSAKSPSPADTSEPGTSRPSTSKPSTSGVGDSTAADKLDEENLIRERLYYDVTGHSFMGDKPGKGEVLSPCTGDETFADSVPRGATILSYTMAGEGGRKVVDQVAHVGSADKARIAADRIVKLVDTCAGISGGDFGYGDPVTVESNAKREVVYLPAYDSDRAAGGYIVVQTGNRVSVVDVNDNVPAKKVAHLAEEPPPSRQARPSGVWTG